MAKRTAREIKTKWIELLEMRGRDAVLAELKQFPTYGNNNDGLRLRSVDAGLMYGADRYPPVSFVAEWLGDNDDDQDHHVGRTSVLTMLGILLIASAAYFYAT